MSELHVELVVRLSALPGGHADHILPPLEMEETEPLRMGEKEPRMPKKSMRGIAPGRARDANTRSGSFKRYHSKRGGRQPGTRNAFSCDYKKAIFEAAHRIGYDGNGKNGLVGYLMWVAVFHPKAFSLLLEHVVPLEALVTSLPVEPLPTMDQMNERVRTFLQLGSASSKQEERPRVRIKASSSADWTGQGFPLSSLMHSAVESPVDFCKLMAAGFLRKRGKRRQLKRPHW